MKSVIIKLNSALSQELCLPASALDYMPLLETKVKCLIFIALC